MSVEDAVSTGMTEKSAEFAATGGQVYRSPD